MSMLADPGLEGGWASTPAVRKRMVTLAAGRDTAPEVALRRELWRRGRRYVVNHPLGLGGVRRSADIVFRAERVAIFVDGCFWHRCPEHASTPRTNAEYWRQKFERNVERDRQTDLLATEAGWRVLRIWEHDDPHTAADIVERALIERRAQILR